MNKFCFIDLETSGLNPQTDKILELACVITDNKLNEIESYSSVVHVDIKSLSMDEWCLKTHTESNLLMEVAKSTKSIEEIDADLVKILRRHFPVMRPALAGSSVSFDKRYIDEKLPLLSKKLHYRIIDVSSFMLGISMYHDITLPRLRENALHRALPDIRDSIQYLKQYLERFK